MSFIFSKMMKYWNKVILSLTIKGIAAVADLVLPFLLAYMIDDLLPNVSEDDLAILYYTGLLMLVVSLVGWTFNIIANRLAERVASQSVADVRGELFYKIEHLSAQDVDDITTTSLISRMTTDTYNLYSMIGSLQRLGIRAPMLLIGGIIMSSFIDPWLTLIMVGLLPFIVFISVRFSKKGRPLYHDIQVQVDNLVRTLRENITGVRVVRALSMTDFEQQRFARENLETAEREVRATVTMSKISPLIDLIMNIGLVIVLVVGAYRVADGYVGVGQMLALVTYFTIILNATMSLTRIFILISRATASANRILEVLHIENVMVDGSEPVVEKENVAHVEFDQVYFSYHAQEDHLENISFKLYKGQTLGIIGATGAGKTTLVNLLMRFYDPKKGQIKVFDTPLIELKKDDLRRHIGLVLQNDLVFSDSIYENVQFSRDNIQDEDIDDAIEIAQAGFIKHIPEQLSYKIAQRGTNVSGGQRQRILIARAVAGKPKLLILDDASSALDYQTDRNLRQALNKKLKDTTKIIVAQRISSIREADLIIMIEDGKIAAKGKHEDLVKNNEQYRILVTHQLGVVE